jgi:hypothetical protein
MKEAEAGCARKLTNISRFHLVHQASPDIRLKFRLAFHIFFS